MSRDKAKAQSDGGKWGNHLQHHVTKNVFNPDCEYCVGTESVTESVTDLHRGEKRKGEKRRGSATPSPEKQNQDPPL